MVLIDKQQMQISYDSYITFYFRNWYDGTRYRHIYELHAQTGQTPFIPIVLYYDELDCSSSGGSPNMKMVMVYFTVAALPTELQGKLHSINLVAYSKI